MQPEIEIILDRLLSIETKLDSLLRQPQVQDYYNVAGFAERVAREEFTVREWCRLGRLHAEKRRCGRGTTQEWKISHEELLRYQSDGLLPDPRRAKAASVKATDQLQQSLKRDGQSRHPNASRPAVSRPATPSG